MFLYKIALNEESVGSSQIISQLRVHALDEDSPFSDDLFTLQIDGTFSGFRVGHDGFHRLFCVHVGEGPLCSIAHIPRYHIVVSSAEYHRSLQSEENMNCSAFGLSVHRLLPQFPFVDCLKSTSQKKAWHERIPFLSQKRAIVTSMEVSPQQSTLVAISNVGDVLWFDLPSMRIRRFTSAEQNDENAIPIQVAWINEESFVILHSNGQITRATPDDYFDGITVDPPLNHLENCKRVRVVEDTTVFALTEVRTDKAVTKENNKVRVWTEFLLFFLFYLSFVAKLVKAMFASFFGGNPTEELKEKVGVEQSAQLALFTTRTITVAEYIEIQLAKHEYQVAIDLATESEGAYDLDLIYKRQWRDIKQKQTTKADICAEDLKVLSNVKDTEWLVKECLHYKTPSTLQLHRLLVELAKRICEKREILDETMWVKVRNAEQILEIVRKCGKHDEEALLIYMKYRTDSIYEFAFAMAEETEFEVLQQVFEVHRTKLRHYLLVVLNAIPESTPPKQYSYFLPGIADQTTVDLNFTLNDGLQYDPPEFQKIPAKFDQFREFLLGIENCDEVKVAEEWFEKRAALIDQFSGLTDDCVKLFELAIERGFEDLIDLGREYMLYRDFVRFSGAVHISLPQLRQWNATKVREHLIKHVGDSNLLITLLIKMSKGDLVENFERVVELIEFVDNNRGQAESEVLTLVKSHCKKDFQLLSALKEARPEFLNTETLVQCFSESEVVGKELTQAMRTFNLSTGLLEVLELCTQLPTNDYTPTFADIHSASREKAKALKLCQRFVKSACFKERPNLQEAALQLAEKQGRDGFKASSGWLGRFKKRHNIAVRISPDREDSVDDSVDQMEPPSWLDSVLQEALGQLEPNGRNDCGKEETGKKSHQLHHWFQFTSDSTMKKELEEEHQSAEEGSCRTVVPRGDDRAPELLVESRSHSEVMQESQSSKVIEADREAHSAECDRVVESTVSTTPQTTTLQDAMGALLTLKSYFYEQGLMDEENFKRCLSFDQLLFRSYRQQSKTNV